MESIYRGSSHLTPVSTDRAIILSINVLQIARVLNENDLIGENLALNLERMQLNGISSEHILNYFLRTFFQSNKHPIDSVLERINNNEIRNQLLVLTEFARLNKGRMQKIWKVDSDHLGHRQFLNNFYRILKKFHNDPKNSYDERLVLFNKFETQISRAIRMTNDPEKQMHLIDKKVVLIAAYIDFLTIKYKNDLPSYAIFEKLRKLNFQRNAGASSTLIPEIVYCQRMGIALAIAGEFDKGEELINHFEFLIGNFDMPCREFGNKCYFKMYFNLWKYEKYPTEILKQSIIKDGEMGLAQEGMCSDDSRDFWKAPLLIKMIYCLLGIGNRGNPFSVPYVQDEDIKRAERYISCVKFGTSSMRREMQLLVAKARVCELKLEYSNALKIVATAKGIALKGQYEELNIITAYQKELQIAMSTNSVQPLDWSRLEISNSSACYLPLDWSGLLRPDSYYCYLPLDWSGLIRPDASGGYLPFDWPELLRSDSSDCYLPLTCDRLLKQSPQFQINTVQLEDYKMKRIIKRSIPVHLSNYWNLDFQCDNEIEKISAMVKPPSISFGWSELLKTENFETLLGQVKDEGTVKCIYEVHSKNNEMQSLSEHQHVDLQAHGYLSQLQFTHKSDDIFLKNCSILTNYDQRNSASSSQNVYTDIGNPLELASDHYISFNSLLSTCPKGIINSHESAWSIHNYMHVRKYSKHPNFLHSLFSSEEISDEELFGDNVERAHYSDHQTSLYDSSHFHDFREDSFFKESSKIFFPWEKYQNEEDTEDHINKPMVENSYELLDDVDFRLDTLSNENYRVLCFKQN